MDLLAVQGTLKSLLQHHSSKASVLRRSAFFTVQLSHPYMTTGKSEAKTELPISLFLGISTKEAVVDFRGVDLRGLEQNYLDILGILSQ